MFKILNLIYMKINLEYKTYMNKEVATLLTTNLFEKHSRRPFCKSFDLIYTYEMDSQWKSMYNV